MQENISLHVKKNTMSCKAGYPLDPQRRRPRRPRGVRLRERAPGRLGARPLGGPKLSVVISDYPNSIHLKQYFETLLNVICFQIPIKISRYNLKLVK